MIYALYFLLSFISPEITYTASADPIVVTSVRPLDTLKAYQNTDIKFNIKHYSPLYRYVACETGFPESLIFAIMWQEHRGSSSLLSNHNNIGNVKWRKNLHHKYQKACFKDDKYVNGKLICSNFVSYPSLKEAADDFAKLLNSNRYQRCKKYSTPQDICKCFKQAGYHTDNSHWQRAKNMETYELRTSQARHQQTADRL